MLKQTHTYKDFDDQVVTEDLYFNLSKTDVTEDLSIVDKFEDIQKSFAGPARELTRAEIQSLLDLVKLIMKLSYGERSVKDGRIRFKKSEDIWDDFRSTAAYDTFLFSLFEEPEKANDFLLGILPQDLRAQATAEAQQNSDIPVAPPVSDNQMTTKSEYQEPTDEQLLKMKPQDMSTDQLRRAFALKA